MDEQTYNNGKKTLISICGGVNAGVSSFTPPKYGGISRVPDEFRSANAKAYKPVVLALGPYSTRDTPTLLETEGLKKRLLREFLERDEGNAIKYWSYMMSMERSLYSFYEDKRIFSEIHLDKFLEMMILDCFFIVELFRMHGNNTLSQLFSRLSQKKLDFIVRDLLLYENQVPLIILHEIADQSKLDHFESSVNEFFEVKWTKSKPSVQDRNTGIYDHYLGIPTDSPDINPLKCTHLLNLFHEDWCPSYKMKVEDFYYGEFASATELKESFGVYFTTLWDSNLFYLTFENGRFEIPRISINDKTEDFLQNLMAYEDLIFEDPLNQYTRYVSDYILVMNELIRSTKDVELLCDRGIINDMGKNHKAILQFFRNLQPHSKKYDHFHVTMNSFYTQLWEEVSKYRSRKRN